MNPRIHLLALMVITLPLTSHANEPVSLLDTIVITGTKTPKRLQDVPVKTEVVTQADIEKKHARDLGESIKNIPGLSLKKIHGKSGYELWIQGMSGDRVLILIDGRPVSASTGSTVDVTQIGTLNIDRIEVVKGAVSALHSSAAMGGVVNIITNKPGKARKYKVTLDAGTYDEFNAGDSPINDVHGSFELGGLLAGGVIGKVSASIRDTQGIDLQPDEWDFDGDSGNKVNVDGTFRKDFSKDNWIQYTPSFYREDLSRNFSTFAPGYGDILNEKTELATRINNTISFQKTMTNKRRLSGHIAHEIFKDDTSQDTVSTDRVDQERNGELEYTTLDLQYDFPVGKNHLLTAGFSAYQAGLEQHQTKRSATETEYIVEVPHTTRTNYDLYLQDDFFIGDNLEILPGIRLQQDSDFGFHSAPKVNAMYDTQLNDNWDMKFRVGIGAGYRTPNLKERHYVFDHSALGYMVLGDPSVTPETSLTYQAGVDFYRNDGLGYDINLFHNNVEDLIATTLSGYEEGVAMYRYANVDEARLQGVEMALTVPVTNNLKIKGSYNYLDAKNTNTNKQLTRRPEHEVKAELDWHLPRLDTDVSLFASWQSEEYVDDANERESPAWGSIDLKLNKNFSKGKTWFVGIDNILNEHKDINNAGSDFRPEKGRFIYTGIRFKN
ncbi:TonB-dependent receptor plug domain-containing protein [Leucothrix arctica]|uniref:TonB-dependent receptor n=1 Tax=Leucothrix arctica TaxID=1481894 RepID=A0A317CFP8_9GAMM|nr:TonB-dependent receptor [Leucothrix arctica]PWQ95160.1 TonB-dependent receptor [Leucothrix arctica]